MGTYDKQKMRFVDLFCGIGGFRLALERHGHECVFSSDIDKKACQAYKDNFGEMPAGDITKIHEDDIPAHDILCGGFPCQSFSIAGKRQGGRDYRLLVINDVFRIAKKHKPSVLLLENVPGILLLHDGLIVTYIKGVLDNIGYDVTVSVLNASYFGVPQARRRVYFVCIKRGSGFKYSDPTPFAYNPNNWELLKDDFYNVPAVWKDWAILEDVIDFNENSNRLFAKQAVPHFIDDSKTQPGMRTIFLGNYKSKRSQGNRIYSIKGHAITMMANRSNVSAKTGLYLIDGRIRALSVLEVKRVMGYPDKHIVSEGREAYKQLGNAVIPEVVYKVFSGIKKE